VSYLLTRVGECDEYDIEKLTRLLGYLKGSRKRGIILRIGDTISVRAYIDASYGVHSTSGRSHSGSFVVIVDAGPVFAKFSKQKIVTKSSTEAELVALSDNAGQAIHVHTLLKGQGYDIGPAVTMYQDHMSCIAIIRRGRPSSERSRQSIYAISGLRSAKILARLSTSICPRSLCSQGVQFMLERRGLTNL
jgi:hypothetical protein